MNGKIDNLLFAAALAACGCASPLIRAVRGGDTARIDALLARGYDLEKRDHWDGYTALGAAVERRDEATIRKLVTHGADLLGGVKVACLADDMRMMDLMIDLGADLKDSKYRYSLFYAIYNSFRCAERLIDEGVDINASDEKGNTALSHAIRFSGKTDVAKLLIVKGADTEAALRRFEDLIASAEYKGNRNGWKAEKRTLEDLIARKDELYIELYRAPKLDPAEEKTFEAEAARYRSLAVKPSLPETARRFKIQAEAAVREKRFSNAVELYAKALGVAPWWPEGHFNRALILGELGAYVQAAREMKRYLKLVPDALDARKAQDKVYEWEGK